MPLGRIGSAISDGLSSAGSAVSSLGSSALDFATDAFGFLGNNDVANMIGGVATGVGSYLVSRDERRFTARENRRDRELQRELQQQEIESNQIVPGSIGSGHGSYRNSISQGLISNGMIAGEEEED